jgi:hypothetical protein
VSGQENLRLRMCLRFNFYSKPIANRVPTEHQFKDLLDKNSAKAAAVLRVIGRTLRHAPCTGPQAVSHSPACASPGTCSVGGAGWWSAVESCVCASAEEEGGAHRNSHRPFALLNMQKGTRVQELQVV